MPKIEITDFEKTILSIAVKRHIEELEKVIRKVKFLGVDTTKAAMSDMNTLKDLETKLL